MFGNNNEKVKEKRFAVTSEQTINFAGISVIQDVQTGVNYILAQGSTGLAITPLVDKDGKILVSIVEQK